MKYQIALDGTYILYDLRDDDLKLENPELNLEVNKVGTLGFSIYPDHPYFDRLENKVSKISVYKNNRTIFRGRIIEEDQGLYNNKSILCESALAYLNDSIVRPGTFSGSPLQFLTMVLNNHNSQSSDDQKLLLGNVTVTDPNNYMARSWTDYISSWEMLEKRGLELIGGYIVERYESNGTYIDWLDDFSDTSTQIIEFGENIIDIATNNNSSKTYTVVIPLGAETDNGDGTKTRLDIKSVNNNLDYLINQTAYEKYGWIVAPINETTWNDVTVASNLKTKGLNYLNNQAVMIASTLEITALDLQATDADIESFFINEYVQVKSTPHNINKTFLLSKITIPLSHPENTQITLGEKINSLTGIELGNKQKLDNTIQRVDIVEKNYTLNDERLDDLESAIEYFSVDLAQYNLTIPTDSTKKPLETKNYNIHFYGYFKGTQVTPTVSISGSNTGITATSTNTYIRFAVNSNTAITNALNEYEITFTYTDNNISYQVTKIIDIALAQNGAAGADGSPGADGAQGIPGTPGTSTYFYVRYSANSNGNPMTTAPQSNSKYMGVASTTSSTAPTSYSAYTWSLMKGEDGSPGTPGEDGTSSYLHIKYSDDGTTFTGNSGEDVGRYRGELVDTNPTDSTTFSDYTWYDMALLVEDELNEIRQEVQTNITSINQSQEEILMTALKDYVATSDFETFRNTVSTMFSQTSDAFNFNFNNITSQINTINGSTQQQFSEISKYIRFVDGNIILGEAGNEITLKIENDRISFTQNNNEVAYFSNNKLNVTDGEFINSLIIGNFAFKPRANGNLSLLYVGGEQS